MQITLSRHHPQSRWNFTFIIHTKHKITDTDCNLKWNSCWVRAKVTSASAGPWVGARLLQKNHMVLKLPSECTCTLCLKKIIYIIISFTFNYNVVKFVPLIEIRRTWRGTVEWIWPSQAPYSPGGLPGVTPAELKAAHLPSTDRLSTSTVRLSTSTVRLSTTSQSRPVRKLTPKRKIRLLFTLHIFIVWKDILSDCSTTFIKIELSPKKLKG